METITVIIPSRAQPNQLRFVERAISSVRSQTLSNGFDAQIVVGVDRGDVGLKDFAERAGLTLVESGGASQALALNAGIRTAHGEYVAFLEDDDQWVPSFLQTAVTVLTNGASFVSSTELEVGEDERIIRIVDFPSPSGWCMSRHTLDTVGEFNEDYCFHLDNEWLGRLAETKVQRVHLVESTAPVTLESAAFVREGLANVLRFGGEGVSLRRHDSPYPLVRRLVHPLSGMSQIAAAVDCSQRSKDEVAVLKERFGRIPW